MSNCCWLSDDSKSVDCLCLGTGRFLRSVLVPALIEAKLKPALIQTRGSNFIEYMKTRATGTYELDTVLDSGAVVTSTVPCYGAFTMGSADGTVALMDFLKTQPLQIKMIGVGVTEAGLANSQTQAMQALFRLLEYFRSHNFHTSELCVVNMDNVPGNGSTMLSHMLDLCGTDQIEMRSYLENRVVFCNTMVDRITSQRDGSDGLVPRCEPLPKKSLIILDPEQRLPEAFQSLVDFGVIVRSTAEQLEADIGLKLRVANGTHTALAQCMALMAILSTDVLAEDGLLMDYLDSLFESQILPGSSFGITETETVYEEWRSRLTHPHFGLSTFFIAQNCAAKGGIRLGPTAIDLVESNRPITTSMVYAWAALLRWLTPIDESNRNEVYTGWFDGKVRNKQGGGSQVLYHDGLHYNLEAGWYEFRCICRVNGRYLSAWLAEIASTNPQPSSYAPVVRAYLLAPDGGNLLRVAQRDYFEIIVHAISTLLARMVVGDGMRELLDEMSHQYDIYDKGFATDATALVDVCNLKYDRPLHFRETPVPDDSKLMQLIVCGQEIADVVISEVASAEAIDLHTHLLPPSHGALCSWGIDELLTYHYLVAEYFITAPSDVTPETFYAASTQVQADMIWKGLFVDRSPVSEACRGVLTTLQAFGLGDAIKNRNLVQIRKFYSNYRDKGLKGVEMFSEHIFQKAGVRYAIMTNIPFDANESQYWRPERKKYSKRYRSALRVDPLLAGDKATIETALKASGYDVTLEGACDYLRDWCDTMTPEYLMASTPHNFIFGEAVKKPTRINDEAMSQPFAFVQVQSSGIECTMDDDERASLIHEDSDFLSDVLMKICEERKLPLALKIGAHRGVNPSLKAAGDGVVAFADTSMLARLLLRFPNVSFLATFLSRTNQQEACVLASKFRNLHIYGCWWFCNQPSIIREMTQMRVEMLGTAFTAQHSDARVLDQLVYKWAHSRSIIARVIAHEYSKLNESGWAMTRAEIRRDVGRLFGGSYEEFTRKKFIK